MDELNQWHSHPVPEDELAYMYQQQEEHARMQGMQQHYTSPLPMAPPPIVARPSSSRPPHPHHSPTCSFPPSALPSLPFGAVAVKNDPGQPSSSSSHRILSFGGQPPSTIDFSGGYWPDGIEAAQQVPAPERRSRAHWNTQAEHVVAERKRREKMQQQFVALATIVPDLTKTDKISLLGSTIEYVKQLEEKVKTLKGQSARRRIMSERTVFESQCRVSTDGSDTSGSRESAFGAGLFSPTVEARIHGDTILLRICCKDRRGVLVMLICELEKHGLSIINTSVVPFTNSCLNITVTAEIGECFPTTV